MAMAIDDPIDLDLLMDMLQSMFKSHGNKKIIISYNNGMGFANIHGMHYDFETDKIIILCD